MRRKMERRGEVKDMQVVSVKAVLRFKPGHILHTCTVYTVHKQSR